MVLPSSVTTTKHNMPCVRLVIHCPFSATVNPRNVGNGCTHNTALNWFCTGCRGNDYIDVEGYLHCDCSSRYNFFATTFICDWP